ncbi:hypothetical protein [Effusibacillus dendaii]|uniref:Uncharacterized protein n=1 Tax=Effusibacillus dendaii TaxID=2743772 RepID=A0A7I8DI97_9BACL|nr:hypothetical protein [Effusibacillus dendaii]BCJ88380.1 hypothetical protein skT53_33650 [Effusibacillus dendaii]
MMRFFRSPFGIALTAVAVILAVSPEARKATRRAAVKGTAAVLDLVDQVREAGGNPNAPNEPPLQ